MSFETKTSMWWGTVKHNTEHFFGKDVKRIVTHEYYDNPNAPTARPKSMHTVASQSRRSIRGNGDDADGSRSAPPRSSSRSVSERSSSSHSVDQDATYDEPQPMVQPAAAMHGAYYPQEDPNMMAMQQQQMGYDQGMGHQQMGAYPQEGGYPPQHEMGYSQVPNMMGGYPQDPNMMGAYPQQQPGMMYPQDANMMTYEQQQQQQYTQQQGY